MLHTSHLLHNSILKPLIAPFGQMNCKLGDKFMQHRMQHLFTKHVLFLVILPKVKHWEDQSSALLI